MVRSGEEPFASPDAQSDNAGQLCGKLGYRPVPVFAKPYIDLSSGAEVENAGGSRDRYFSVLFAAA
jgi:hypothetical protein